METVTQCPVCQSSQFKPFLVCQDYLVSQQEFTIQECIQCNFRLTNPRPNADSIGNYYKSEEYVSHNDNSSGLVNTAYRMVRNYTLRAKLSLINELNKGAGKLLDVGCGTGAFLETCQQGGWQVMGMEPDQDARAIASRKLDLTIKSNLDELGQDQQYDVISLWHVLEHVSNLEKTVSQLYTLLYNKGTLLIAVPNSESFDAQAFGKYWAAYDVPRHLYHFTPKTIDKLFAKNGFKLIEQRPMVFDAFYIAMLSTRYQVGKTDYLKSINIGLKSNTKARKTKQYSSVIYLFNKA